MSRIVYKYSIAQGEATAPEGEVVYFGLDPIGNRCFWVEHEDTKRPFFKEDDIRYKIFGTGQSIPTESIHCGSFVEDIYVWHLYRLP